MLSTGRFDIKTPTKWGDFTYTQAYTTAFNRHQKLIAALLDATRAFQLKHQQYSATAQALLEQLEVFEENGDGMGEGRKTAIAEIQQSSEQMMYVAVVAGVVLALLSILTLLHSILQPLHHITQRVREVAQGEGDLTRRLNITTQDEIGTLAREFDGFLNNIHGLVKQVKSRSEQMSTAINSMQHIASESTQRVDQ